MKKSKKIAIILSVVIILVAIILLLIKFNTKESETKLSNLRMELSDGNKIEFKTTSDVTSYNKSLKIINDGKAMLSYDLILNDVINQFDSSDLLLTVKCTETDLNGKKKTSLSSTCRTLTNVPVAQLLPSILDNVYINANSIQKYEFIFESKTLDKKFSAKIKLKENKIYNVNVTTSTGGKTFGYGKYAEGEEIILMAIPDEDNTFDGWYLDDKLVSTSATYNLTVDKNYDFYAKFSLSVEKTEEKTQSKVITVQNSETNKTSNSESETTNETDSRPKISVLIDGDGSVSGTGKFNLNEETTLRAKSKIGYTFDGWYLDDELISTSPNYKIKVTNSMQYKAIFKKLAFEQYDINYNNFTTTLNDDFDGEALNNNVWSRYYSGQSWRNWYDRNSFVKNSNLTIKTEVENGVNIAGSVYTKNKFEQAYGYYELRAKLSNVEGMWPGFWMVAGNVFGEDYESSDGSEIDIFEAISKQNELISTITWDGYSDSKNNDGYRYKITDAFDEEYHTFGFLWTKSGYSFYFDGKEYYRTKAAGITPEEAYILISTNIGDYAGLCGDLDTSKLPDYFEADYLRVYQISDYINYKEPDVWISNQGVLTASSNDSTITNIKYQYNGKSQTDYTNISDFVTNGKLYQEDNTSKGYNEITSPNKNEYAQFEKSGYYTAVITYKVNNTEYVKTSVLKYESPDLYVDGNDVVLNTNGFNVKYINFSYTGDTEHQYKNWHDFIATGKSYPYDNPSSGYFPFISPENNQRISIVKNGWYTFQVAYEKDGEIVYKSTYTFQFTNITDSSPIVTIESNSITIDPNNNNEVAVLSQYAGPTEVGYSGSVAQFKLDGKNYIGSLYAEYNDDPEGYKSKWNITSSVTYSFDWYGTFRYYVQYKPYMDSTEVVWKEYVIYKSKDSYIDNLILTGLDSSGNTTTTASNITQYMVGDGTSVSGNGIKNKTIKYLYIPQKYNNLPITKIGKNALQNQYYKRLDAEYITDVDNYGISSSNAYAPVIFNMPNLKNIWQYSITALGVKELTLSKANKIYGGAFGYSPKLETLTLGSLGNSVDIARSTIIVKSNQITTLNIYTNKSDVYGYTGNYGGENVNLTINYYNSDTGDLITSITPNNP